MWNRSPAGRGERRTFSWLSATESGLERNPVAFSCRLSPHGTGRDPSRRRVAFLSSSPIRRPISFSFLFPFLFLPLCFILERREFVARSSSNAKKGVPGGTRGAEKMFRENRWRGCNRSAVERGD